MISLRVMKLFLLCTSIVGLGIVACSDSESGNNDPNGGSPPCLAALIELTETKLTDSPSAHTLLLDFDAKNTSTEAYDIQAGSQPIMLDFQVTTTDGAKYESTAPFTALKIGPGATSTTVAQADYGANKTYQSYEVSLRCR